jgi:glycerol-3-phosphate dehydrogenase
VDFLVAEVAKMLPVLADTRYIRAYAGVRPLVAAETGTDDRAISRGFVVLDHETEGCSNFVTVTGGKLTTFRLMAEKAADLVCNRLGVKAPCLTRTLPLSSSGTDQWTEPGLAARFWMEESHSEDILLCECEMVPMSVVDQILDELKAKGDDLDFSAISLRSRLGRGSCQGAFCGFRTCAHLYERGVLNSDQGLSKMRRFLERRWHGLRPVLWGSQLIQEELQEALHCDLLGLELED